jgi:phage gpG-like protein
VSVVGLKVTYTVGRETGDDVVRNIAVALERAGAEVAQFGKYAFPHLIPVFESAEKRQFSAEGAGPSSGHWAALSAAYAKWKAKKYPGKPVLERSGKLRKALTSNGPNAVRDYSASMMNFGTTDVEYASFHQMGTPFMPARPPFDFDAQFEKEMRQAAQLGLIDAVRAAKLDSIAEVTE